MLVEIYCNKFKTGGKDGEVRPVIKFHKGLNAIIGDDNRSNSIGKSTLLMIIDFVFGGDDYIYKCSAVHNADRLSFLATMSLKYYLKHFQESTVSLPVILLQLEW